MEKTTTEKNPKLNQMENIFDLLVLQTALQISLIILDLQCQDSSKFLDPFFISFDKMAKNVKIRQI